MLSALVGRLPGSLRRSLVTEARRLSSGITYDGSNADVEALIEDSLVCGLAGGRAALPLPPAVASPARPTAGWLAALLTDRALTCACTYRMNVLMR